MPEPSAPYFLGAPIWACDQWVGSLYSSANRRRWLGEYSQVFGTVEGNSTFYALPPKETVARWASEAREGFRFALKFPRAVSHDAMLVGAEGTTAEFLELLYILRSADRMGPAFLQLPPNFSGRQLSDLAAYLRKLPSELEYAVEFRHPDFFDEGPVERDADALLAELGIDRVLFDSRALYSAPPTDDAERESQRRKPRSPYRTTVTAARPMVRFIGRNQVGQIAPWIAEWTATVAEWIGQGLTPFVFIHAPADEFALEFAAAFHAALGERVPNLAPLAEFPGRAASRQQSLFE